MDRDARSRQNSPQIVRHRLLPCQGAGRVDIDFFLKGIRKTVAGNHLLRQRGIVSPTRSAHDSVPRIRGLREPRFPSQAVQIFVKDA